MAGILGTTRLVLRRPWRLWLEARVAVDEAPARRFVAVASAVAGGTLALVGVVTGALAPVPRDAIVADAILRESSLPDLVLPMAYAPGWLAGGLTLGLFGWLLARGGATPVVLVRGETGKRAGLLSLYAAGAALMVAAGGALTAASIGVIAMENGLRLLGVGACCAGYLLMFWGLLAMCFTPLYLMRKAGASWLRVVLGGLIWVVQFCLIAVTAVAFGGWLPGYLRMCWHVVLG